jgi:SAM-dependent methyltransferase
MNCRICENSDNLKTFEVREMMFGLRDVFAYFQCPVCGCLQISDIPEDMSEYYPPEYYSFTQSVVEKNSVKAILKKIRDRYAITGDGFPGMILNRMFPDEILSIYKGMSFDSRILDVGCGSGSLIYRLKEAGFRNLMGIDPFNAATIQYDNGLIIEKKSISEMNGKWDMITYHHSFEHLATPHDELKIVMELLSEKGKCIIRIPVVDSWAWEHYQTDWVQIDAPRHFFLYSVKSIFMLAEKAGLMIDRVEYDSTAFQFWGSEQYRNDIPLNDERSYQKNPGVSMISKGDLMAFIRLSNKLNCDRKGDQAVFYLKRRFVCN